MRGMMLWIMKDIVAQEKISDDKNTIKVGFLKLQSNFCKPEKFASDVWS